MFKLKCVIYNLNIIETEESYTSQASFLDMDKIPTYKKGKNNNCQLNLMENVLIFHFQRYIAILFIVKNPHIVLIIHI